MMRSTQSHCLLFLVVLLHVNVFVIGSINADAAGAAGAAGAADAETSGWSWSKILSSRKPIIANGNIWPAPTNEASDDCLILVTRNQLMWHCPTGNETSYERAVLFRGSPGRYSGAFMGLGSNDEDGKGRRMWVLHSPTKQDDELLELDTVTGKILQRLVIAGSVDGHDAIRVGNRAFIVDTRHGNIVEIAVPPSSAPYTNRALQAGAEPIESEGYVNIIKRHAGFTRADHVNNVAVHPDLLISSLHGKGAMNPKITKGSVASPTRLSALDRNAPEVGGRELGLRQDGFEPVGNVGKWCHGIAFWEDTATNQIKLISLDSKAGTMVSVALAGPNRGQREVLWSPDESHPTLQPPEGIARAYNNGAKIFSKGLAVQGSVAYFGVSYARAGRIRQTVPESLLVAVDLTTKKELWVRTVRSNGIINQILTRSYLGDVKLPVELSSVELTQHGGGAGQLVDFCEDLSDECALAYTNSSGCKRKSSIPTKLCCVCKGGQRTKKPLLAGTLDVEIMKIKENVDATATFVPHHNCRDKNGQTKRLPLEMKLPEKLALIKSIDRDLDNIVKHLCNVNVEDLGDFVRDLGDEGFTTEFQHQNGNAVITDNGARFKPGCEAITLVFSSKSAEKIYHFPWLDEWLPMLQELVLEPLGIPLNQILRMQLANMPRGSDIQFHKDGNPWVRLAHRTHVPIVTHPGVFFLVEFLHQSQGENTILRIKSNVGEVYEFNNAKGHAVRNLGPSRVHLIIDWVEEAVYDEEKNDVDALVKLRPRDVCTFRKGFSELNCGAHEMNAKTSAQEEEEIQEAKETQEDEAKESEEDETHQKGLDEMIKEHEKRQDAKAEDDEDEEGCEGGEDGDDDEHVYADQAKCKDAGEEKRNSAKEEL